MKKYYDYIDSNNFSAALQLLNDNPLLKRCIVNAETLNGFEHKIIALQRFFLDNFQQYIQNAIKFKGEWSSQVTYNKFDVVTYASTGMTYIAIELNIPIGTLPSNKSYFVQWSIKGEQGVSGYGLSPRGAWNPQREYYPYDLVYYNNHLWYTEYGNSGVSPTESTPAWTKVVNIVIEGIETETAVTNVSPDGNIAVNVIGIQTIGY